MTPPAPAGRDISRLEFIALVASLMSLNALAIDIMLPALPNMGAALGIAVENDRQLVISAYMFGIGFAQLLFGPLTDRFGRRLPLIFGLIVYVTAALTAIAAPSFTALLVLRFVQGLGAASFRVVANAAVRDRFAGRRMAEVMSLVFMVFMAIPIVAPGIGQLLLFAGPWQLIFLFVASFGTLIGIWAYFRLPETLDPANRRPLTFTGIAQGFVIVVTNRAAFSYAIAGMFVFGALVGFINTAQQVYVGIYGLGTWFPLAFAGVAGLMAVASFLNSRMVGHFGMRRLAHFALIVFTVVSVVWLVMSLFGTLPFALFFVMLATTMFMFSWSSANMNALSMQPLGSVAGTAAAAFGFIQILGGTFIGLLIGRMFDGTTTPVASGFSAVGFIALALVLFAEKGKLFGVTED